MEDTVTLYHLENVIKFCEAECIPADDFLSRLTGQEKHIRVHANTERHRTKRHYTPPATGKEFWHASCDWAVVSSSSIKEFFNDMTRTDLQVAVWGQVYKEAGGGAGGIVPVRAARGLLSCKWEELFIREEDVVKYLQEKKPGEDFLQELLDLPHVFESAPLIAADSAPLTEKLESIEAEKDALKRENARLKEELDAIYNAKDKSMDGLPRERLTFDEVKQSFPEELGLLAGEMLQSETTTDPRLTLILNETYSNHSPELALAIRTWLSVFGDPGDTPRRTTKKTLEEKARKLAPKNPKGEPICTKTALERISIVINPNKTGGAPQTP